VYFSIRQRTVTINYNIWAALSTWQAYCTPKRQLVILWLECQVKAKWSGQGHLADNSSGIALRMSDQFTARLLCQCHQSFLPSVIFSLRRILKRHSKVQVKVLHCSNCVNDDKDAISTAFSETFGALDLSQQHQSLQRYGQVLGMH